jgi:hypothetical protein
MLLRIVRIPNGQNVVIESTRLGGIRFFLFGNFNPITLTEALQRAIQRKYRDLREVLIVALAQIDRLSQVRAVAHNNLAEYKS